MNAAVIVAAGRGTRMGLERNKVPVSYTHVDVYKRQS